MRKRRKGNGRRDESGGSSVNDRESSMAGMSEITKLGHKG